MIVGGVAVTAKAAALVPVPAGAVTEIGPLSAPAGTVAVIWVAEFSTNTVAGTPPNRTAVVPEKLVPVMVTTVPAGPVIGAKEAIEGAVVVTLRDQPPAICPESPPTSSKTNSDQSPIGDCPLNEPSE
jgi:hypothetical protein